MNNTLEITQAGMQASITNSPNRNGFRIEIGYVDIISNGRSTGHSACYGVGTANNLITIAAEIKTAGDSWPITQLNFYDSISNKIFAIARPPENGVIDYIISGKKTFICLNLGFMILPENTVTVSANVDDFLGLHKKSEDAHKHLFDLLVSRSKITGSPNLSYDVEDSNRLLTAKYLYDLNAEITKFNQKNNEPKIEQHNREVNGEFFHGRSVIFLDGLVHQEINLSNVDTRDRNIFIQQRNSLIIDFPLFTRMAEIFSVDIYLDETFHANYATDKREAEEWLVSWAKTQSTDSRVRVNMRRWHGDWSLQGINMRVIVTGLKG